MERIMMSVPGLLVALAVTLSTVLGPRAGAAEDTATAVFAGGCFWCVEEAFDGVDGVIDHTAGFAGGHVENPSYDQVVAGGTGHVEAVRVEYDPADVSYERLLHVFWRNIDPLDDGGQFCDRGSTYRTVIFVQNEDQRRAAERSREELEQSGRFDRPIATEIIADDTFYAAEEYHQDYFKKRPLRYKFYVSSCGRYGRLDEVWGDEARPGHG
ncbi:peptide-methionine (S)-S-oxide reductase MsrA [Aquisalimonas lutea]|uniref:peptide-methionine (S)-S-oxide reductase MsrA n=1 Tax=Aquisalimonas lutea TaxID=1327750 RepID=UPI0025B3207A|nr:peptide-methionine (S)-S-oxide reductase MsrA [Aquisalimonas lutea]MDN3517589.1 peptide-methionine (S)-S-oxide reductase MsrA [Aquisalimonas lutea]